MALGKAFIEVHADTKPFARELGREIARIIKVVENTSARKAGESFGTKLSDGIGDGIRKNRKKIGDSVGSGIVDGVVGATADTGGLFARFAKGIVDTIDDGLSGLPAELKVVLGASLVAAAPLVGTTIAQFIAAALAAGLTLGVAGLGALVAFQFEEVKDRALEVFASLRNQIVEDGQSLFPVLVAALDMVESRLLALRPIWVAVFSVAEQVILPVTDALLGFIEEFSTSLVTGLGQIDEFADILGGGLREIGAAFGTVLAIIASDDDAKAALTDLLLFIRDLIVFTGLLVKIFLDLYGAMRDVFTLLDGIGIFQTEVAGFNDEQLRGAEAAAELSQGIRGTASMLEAEQKALDETNKKLQKYIDDTFASWDANINFEQSLDDMEETLRRNRGALDLNSQAGRDNQRAIMDAAAALIEQRNRTIELTGNTEHANTVFATNRARLESQAAAAGINRDRFRELTNAVLSVPPPQDTGVTQASVNRAVRLLQALRSIGSAVAAAGRVGAQVASGFQMYAEGGIVSRPTLAMAGEAGPEAILPLNNPARSAQILGQTGLSGMLTPTVNVFIGNDQLTSYIDTQVAQAASTTARSLAYGNRGI